MNLQEQYRQELIEYLEEFKQNPSYSDIWDYINFDNSFYDSFGVNLYSYIRVSTKNKHADGKEQDFGRQILELYKYLKENKTSININNIYCDKYTGKKLKREGYQEEKEKIQANEYLIVPELSRIGRNWEEIKSEWQNLRQDNINVIIMDNSMLSSPLPNNPKPLITLEYKFIQEIVFNAINYVASKKIEEVSRSTKDGLEKARIKGKRIGKPCGKNTTLKNFIKVLELQIDGTRFEWACESVGFPSSTFALWLRNFRQKYNTNDKKELLEKLRSEQNENK